MARQMAPQSSENENAPLEVTPAWDTFLSKYAPTSAAIATHVSEDATDDSKLRTPDLKLHCNDEDCEREQIFGCASDASYVPPGDRFDFFLIYVCRNCRRTAKSIAVGVKRPSGGTGAAVYKYGECPPFAPFVSPRMLGMVQPDRELFEKGLRAEAQGLGIGAFTYYRRVVEQQKDRIFEQVIEVAKTLKAKQEDIATLQSAKKSFRFSSSAEEIKFYMPESLRISGKNPLTLLYRPLSKGVHNLTDEQCLKLARDVRVVLNAFADKLAAALEDNTELAASVASIIKGP